jgi:hypothetical protein
MLDSCEDVSHRLACRINDRSCDLAHSDPRYLPPPSSRAFCEFGIFTDLVVAGMDVLVIKPDNLFFKPKVRLWFPVADGSQVF